ncbi:cytochrome c family protein [Collimonas arenae]|uniref:Cytochrome c family protein n=1 Tax=Collimonas arenae TaxID=279058 RepID=A0A127QM48_9BURK|nr:c-type cytochrome [Collimonas arenae]AMP01228.1 cytochrome c family protein [Collimonas arenae]AMP11124.1 cytochrome c family protein [Collimonas arenae]
MSTLWVWSAAGRARHGRSSFLFFLAATLLGIAAHAAEVDSGPVPDTIKQRLTACTACHGEQGRATNDGYYPRIAGKPAGYLYNQLHNFREGRRRYPMMTYLVDHLSDAYLQEIAQYFADQHPPYPAPQPFDLSSATRARGEMLVNKGDADKKIPACIACHGSAMTGVQPATPGLLGLPRDYLVGQIGAWKNGARHAVAPDCMAQVVQRLSAEDIGAVAAWLAAQPVPADAAAVAPTSVKLPLACGSVPN